ncbi:MAG TPA: hypothetical protein VGA08_02515 [Candidatus Saccharimonadales bacterium]
MQPDNQVQPNQGQVGPQPTNVPPTPGAPVQGTPPAGMVAAKSTNPNSTQNTLHIAEIRDGIVIMRDGSYRSVVMAQSINFDLMSPQEREAVEYGYQGFLNSLYFPIQIFIRSKKIDMRPYLEKLVQLRSEQENMLLGLLMEDYVAYIDALVQQTNIMDKQFYVVVPYFPTIDISKPVEAGKKVFSGFFELFKINKSAGNEVITINEGELGKAKQELKNRVQSVVGGLNQMSVQAIPLDTQELIELYYDVYNPDTATRQNLRNVSDLEAPIVEKGESPAQPEQYTGSSI